jgi:mannitol/fructose-specific phosphotransferase system IIA component (Ntr-type)
MKIGIHALYGFFLAGIMAGQSSALSQRTRQIISQMVHAIFVPLFFVNIGLKTNIITDFDPLLAVLFCIFGIGGRFLGGWIGVSITRISHANRLSVAIAQTPGGAMEIVIAILALQMGLITEPVFVAIVVAAVVSSIIVGPMLSLSLRSRAHISVLEFFTRFGIVSDLKPTDRDAVIERLCTVAAEQENIGDVDQIVHAVLVRENAASTGMEEGVAVPHARLPLLKRPVVVFGRSLAGVDWNSPDGKPARFIFLILTSEHDLEDQVQILGSIAKAMSDEKLRVQVLNAPDSNAIWHILRSALAPAQIKRRRRGK